MDKTLMSATQPEDAGRGGLTDRLFGALRRGRMGWPGRGAAVVAVAMAVLIAACASGGPAWAGIGKATGSGPQYARYSAVYDAVADPATRADAITGVLSLAGPEFRDVALDVGRKAVDPAVPRACRFAVYQRTLELLNTAYGNGQSVREFGTWAGRAAGFIAKRYTGSRVVKSVAQKAVRALFDQTAATGTALYMRGQARANLLEAVLC